MTKATKYVAAQFPKMGDKLTGIGGGELPAEQRCKVTK
jgi:hypothetical protein